MQSILKILITHIRMIWESPKEYLYTWLYASNRKVHITPYDPSFQKYAKTIHANISKIFSGIPVYHIGSSNLPISGDKDIDFIAQYPGDQLFEVYTSVSKTIGSPIKIRKHMIQWKYYLNNTSVELTLVSAGHKRFEEQMTIFRILRDFPSVRSAYVKLKQSHNGNWTRAYNFAKIQFFDAIRFFRNPEDEQQSSNTKSFTQSGFPTVVSGYKFHKNINTIHNNTPFRYAIYRDRKRKHFFAKMLVKPYTSRQYDEMKNEIMALRYFSHAINLSGVTTVHIPNLVYSSIQKSSLLCLSEYIGGTSIQHLPQDKLTPIITEIQKYLQGFVIQSWYHPRVLNRKNLYWIFRYPFICFYVCIIKPHESLLWFRAFFELTRRCIPVIKDNSVSLIHRDLGYWNIKQTQSEIILYDFQLASLGHPVIDSVVYFIKTYQNRVNIQDTVFSRFLSSSVSTYYLILFCLLDMIYGEPNAKKNTIQLLKQTLRASYI